MFVPSHQYMIYFVLKIKELFHQFEVEEYTYLSKSGEMKSDKQPIRKDFNKPIWELITKFESKESA